MTIATYPDIRLALIGKTRSVLPGYVLSDGFPREQQLSIDNPVTWSFKLAFKQTDAATFQQWVLDNARRWFTMPLKTEQGIFSHTVHFTDGGYPSLTRTERDVYFYSCEVICRKIIREFDESEIAELFAEYTEWDAVGLDLAINAEWP